MVPGLPPVPDAPHFRAAGCAVSVLAQRSSLD
jgi:hypothetical protein